MAESLRAKVEEHLSCAICLEHFKDPKVLPCQHTYCLECIAKLDMTRNILTCPECRTITEVPYPPDVSFLPSNFFAKNLLATLATTNDSAKPIQTSSEVKDKAANPTLLNPLQIHNRSHIPSPPQRRNRSCTASPSQSRSRSRTPSSPQSWSRSRTPSPPQSRNRSRTPSPPQRCNRSRTPSPPQSWSRSRTPSPTQICNRSRTPSPSQSWSRSRTPSPPQRRNRSRTPSPSQSWSRSCTPSPPQRCNRSRTPSPSQRRNRSRTSSSSQSQSRSRTSSSSQSWSQSSTSSSSQSRSRSRTPSPPRSRFPRGSFVGGRIFRYGIHDWSVEIDHSDCPGDDSCVFEIGVISHVNACTVAFEGFIMPGCCEEFSLDLNMPDDTLSVDASWLCEPAEFDVNLPRLSPYLKLDCETCLIAVTKANFHWHFQRH